MKDIIKMIIISPKYVIIYVVLKTHFFLLVLFLFPFLQLFHLDLFTLPQSQHYMSYIMGSMMGTHIKN
jgi:hypothetical protein